MRLHILTYKGRDDMTCPKCKKQLTGYRCPDCNYFLLDDPKYKGKKYSLYHKETARENRRMWPAYAFLILFVSAWLFVISYFTMGV